MNLFPAQPFDIPAIMKIERQAFIPSIQEKRKTFEKRLEVFPQGFIILSDSSESTVKKFGNALTCGYLCSELWEDIPSPQDDEKIYSRKFSLGHNPQYTHKSTGKYLYITSFALLHDYRGRGTGSDFFRASLAALCGAFPKIKEVLLLVNQEWENAISIYKKHGFEEIHRIHDFFPTLRKQGLFKHQMADGIVMTCNAEKFRDIELQPSSNNIFSGIKI